MCNQIYKPLSLWWRNIWRYLSCIVPHISHSLSLSFFSVLSPFCKIQNAIVSVDHLQMNNSCNIYPSSSVSGIHFFLCMLILGVFIFYLVCAKKKCLVIRAVLKQFFDGKCRILGNFSFACALVSLANCDWKNVFIFELTQTSCLSILNWIPRCLNSCCLIWSTAFMPFVEIICLI